MMGLSLFLFFSEPDVSGSRFLFVMAQIMCLTCF